MPEDETLCINVLCPQGVTAQNRPAGFLETYARKRKE